MSNNVYTTMEASNHCTDIRQSDDYYATDPTAVERLLQVERFHHYIWEPACGEGHISKVLERHGYDVCSTDLIYRGYGCKQPSDFLKFDDEVDQDIITNPPYKYALEFAQKAIDSVAEGRTVAMLLRLQFLEGKKRKQFFKENPPIRIYVFSDRIECAKNGEFVGNCAVAFAWFIWKKRLQRSTYIRLVIGGGAIC